MSGMLEYTFTSKPFGIVMRQNGPNKVEVNKVKNPALVKKGVVPGAEILSVDRMSKRDGPRFFNTNMILRYLTTASLPLKMQFALPGGATTGDAENKGKLEFTFDRKPFGLALEQRGTNVMVARVKNPLLLQQNVQPGCELLVVDRMKKYHGSQSFNTTKILQYLTTATLPVTMVFDGVPLPTQEEETTGGRDSAEELKAAEERIKARAEAKVKVEMEEKMRKEAEEKARADAEAEAEAERQRELEEQMREEAEEQARKEMEEQMRKEAEEKARREMEERIRQEAEEKIRKEMEAKREQEEREAAEQRAREEAEAAARETELREKIEAEERARQSAQKLEERAEIDQRLEAMGEQSSRRSSKGGTLREMQPPSIMSVMPPGVRQSKSDNMDSIDENTSQEGSKRGSRGSMRSSKRSSKRQSQSSGGGGKTEAEIRAEVRAELLAEEEARQKRESLRQKRESERKEQEERESRISERRESMQKRKSQRESQRSSDNRRVTVTFDDAEEDVQRLSQKLSPAEQELMLRKQLEEGWDNSYIRGPGSPAKGAIYCKFSRPLACTSITRPGGMWGLHGATKPPVKIKVVDHSKRIITRVRRAATPVLAGKISWPLKVERKPHWNSIPVAEKVTHGRPKQGRGPTSPPIVTGKIARPSVMAKRCLKQKRKMYKRARKSRSVSSTSYTSSTPASSRGE